MAAEKQPTNAKILERIEHWYGELNTLGERIYAAQERINDLEKWKSNVEAVEAYKTKNPPGTTSKQWLAFAASLVVVITTLLTILKEVILGKT